MSAVMTAGVLPNEVERRNANKQSFENLHIVMRDGRRELKLLRLWLTLTYWVVVILSIIMFVVGIVLLSVPAVLVFQGRSDELQAVIAAGFGLADLTALFLFKPIERIHRLMGDMSQITVALSGFQTEVELRLIQMDAGDRSSVGQAASAVSQIAAVTIQLIQKYFETAATAQTGESQ